MPRKQPDLTKMLALAEYAETRALTVKFLRDQIANGTLPAYRVGGRRIRVDPDEADQALVSRIPTVRR